MNGITVLVPLNPDGTVHHRLEQARKVATCRVHDGSVADWIQHDVDWDTTYGVEVRAVVTGNARSAVEAFAAPT